VAAFTPKRDWSQFCFHYYWPAYT